MTALRSIISPVDFANLVVTAQANRMIGQSKIEAARRSCVEHGISDDWLMVVLSFINDSPASADSWAERMYEQSLARMAAQVERDSDG